jgi:HEAT repeat protein
MMGFRRLKADTLRLLVRDDFEPGVMDQLAVPHARKVNPLIRHLYHGDRLIRWRAAAALGHVVARMASGDLEAARVVMRRLMWNLNDESGGIGWGSPEAMAEIMARHHRLANEFAPILVSYLNPCGNFLEHPGLQHGVLWGIGRLGRVRADRVAAAAPFILPFFDHDDPALRGMAVWAGGATDDNDVRTKILNLIDDPATFSLFEEHRLIHLTVSQAAARVLRG